ncbi:MAG: tetratricopeptide repeat protein [Planctomycetota bacterium]|nr:tetratricopeptide repeat protein [Planctomycetota bacterium]
MRINTLILAALLTACASARADSVTVGKLAYNGVKIIEVSKGTVSFRVRVGTRVTKSLSEVSAVEISKQPRFNLAEKLLLEGKAAEAVEAYDVAAAGMPKAWMKRLVQYRRLQALEKAGQVDRAIEEWLVAVEQGGAAQGVLLLRPARLRPKGDKQNDRAINLLEKRLKGIGDKAVSAAIKELLLMLYKQQGYHDKGGAIAQEISAGLASAESEKSAAPVDGSGSLTGRIRAAEFLLQQGQAAKALKVIQDNLRRYSPSDLSMALLVAGKAQMALYEKAEPGPQRRKLLLSAGLNFMRVVTFFGSLNEAAEALYQAGRVNVELGNPQAAKNAYESVIVQYPNSKAAEKAKAALEALEK